MNARYCALRYLRSNSEVTPLPAHKIAACEFHPAADIFPLMGDTDLADLAADIQANGQREPIVLRGGRVLDGRNRYLACQMLGIEPESVNYEGEDPVAYVVSLNLHRRHLTPTQRAMVALDLLPMLEAQAKERQGARTDITAQMPEGSGEAREHAATIAKVAPRYVSDAKRIVEARPDLAEPMRRGDMKLTEARRQVHKAELTERATQLPSGKYRVIYADPPWFYGNAGLDQYGPAERHYPSMSLAELCALRVVDLALRDAVLFLWSTSPMLPDALAVMGAWGFAYKTSFVWDKVKHNFGHYNSVRHELLLIGTRGSCTPDTNTLFDSVQVIERSDRHSEKPVEFRTIIEALYTWGPRVELFARSEAPGWTAWGNEV